MQSRRRKVRVTVNAGASGRAPGDLPARSADDVT
jgi:hypothetical protein